MRNEGIARELVNRIQNLRKDTNLNVTDNIDVVFQFNTILETAIAENLTYIKQETLTENITFVDHIDDGRDIEFDDVKTVMTLNKI